MSSTWFHVQHLVADFLFDDQLVLHIHGKLDVVAHAYLGHARHRPAVRIGQPDLILAAAFQFIQHALVALTLGL